MRFPGFIGPAYQSRSSADLQALINLYLERNESGNGPNEWVLYSSAGIAPFASVGAGPIRAIWVGDERLFVVSGAGFYEVFQGGGTSFRGTVANDGKIAQIIPNGNQLMVISGGQCYIDNGTGLIQPVYAAAQGQVSTAGVNVTCIWGDSFDASMVGNPILINGTDYTVESITDAYHMVLAAPGAPAQTDVPYVIPNAGTVATNGTAVARLTGQPFDPALAGHTITIDGSDYTVASVTNGEYLNLTGSAGQQGPVSYTATVPVTAGSGVFIDGYFLIATPESKQINVSNVYNGLRFDPLSFARKEGYPDNVLNIIADHDAAWLFGKQSIELWRNVGNADFPFQRDPSGFIQKGLGAKDSVAILTQGPVWLSANEFGGPVAYYAEGYTPKRVSTHALEYAWAQYTQWRDAESFTWVEDGHEFWQLNFPSGNASWVYDATNGTWHQRAYGTNLDRHRARLHGFVWGKHIVGDYSNGQLYRMSSEITDDAGVAIRRIRRAPYVRDEFHRMVHTAFRVEGDNPAGLSWTLKWSNDYGDNWTSPRAPDGTLSADGYPSRVIGWRWNRLGSFVVRAYELEVSGAAKIAIYAADVEGS